VSSFLTAHQHISHYSQSLGLVYKKAHPNTTKSHIHQPKEMHNRK